MAKPTVIVDTRGLKRAMIEIEKSFGKTAKRKLFSRIARDLRTLTRKRFTTQGDGSWAPLSKWTQARTGRRKALITLRGNIKARWDSNKAEIYFDKIDPAWSITDHHHGYVSRAVSNKRMTVPLKLASKLGLGTASRMTFYNRKASRVPARKVWLSQRLTKKRINKEMERYTAEVEQRINKI